MNCGIFRKIDLLEEYIQSKSLLHNIKSLQKRVIWKVQQGNCAEPGGSPGLVIIGVDLGSRGHGFESHHCILVGHFSHL